MPKAKLNSGRQAQEIGASIIGAWLKVLPPSIAANITAMNAINPLTITVNTNMFASGHVISLRNSENEVTRDVLVGTVTATSPTSQRFTILQANGNPLRYPRQAPTMQGGAVATATPLIELHDDLTVVLQEVIKERVNLVFDQPGEINIVVPTLPNDVLTRDDLLKYLRDYHQYGQGRHYHEELATAVLFGCR